MPPHEERAFFDAFDAALSGDAAGLSPWLADDSTAGLAVYRNTIASGAVDALTATYATVVMMTGEDWFRAAAREYVLVHPPREPALLSYGESFEHWLSQFPPAADTPYLAGIARLDWLWWQSWCAADDQLLDGADLAEISPAQLSELTLGLHPSLRIAAFANGTPALWLAHQAPARGGEHVLGRDPERMVFVRLGAQVEARLITAGPYAFLDALSRGASLLEAGQAALAAEPACALHQIIVTGLALGLFTCLTPVKRNTRHDN